MPYAIPIAIAVSHSHDPLRETVTNEERSIEKT